jgi:hypothetical protein
MFFKNNSSNVLFRASGVHKVKYGAAKDLGMPWILFQLVKFRSNQALRAQGYGFHTQKEGK